jgi:hypothetical protein
VVLAVVAGLVRQPLVAVVAIPFAFRAAEQYYSARYDITGQASIGVFLTFVGAVPSVAALTFGVSIRPSKEQSLRMYGHAASAQPGAPRTRPAPQLPDCRRS